MAIVLELYNGFPEFDRAVTARPKILWITDQHAGVNRTPCEASTLGASEASAPQRFGRSLPSGGPGQLREDRPVQEQEPSCVLRTLTLCDDQGVVSLSPRTVRERCYCARLAELVDDQVPELAQRLRTDRARTVARSADLGRLEERRARLTQSASDERW